MIDIPHSQGSLQGAILHPCQLSCCPPASPCDPRAACIGSEPAGLFCLGAWAWAAAFIPKFRPSILQAQGRLFICPPGQKIFYNPPGPSTQLEAGGTGVLEREGSCQSQVLQLCSFVSPVTRSAWASLSTGAFSSTYNLNAHLQHLSQERGEIVSGQQSLTDTDRCISALRWDRIAET